MTMDRSHTFIYLLSFIYFLIVVLWSLVIPFNGAPDEFTHLYLVEYIYKNGSIPRPGIDPVAPFVGALSGWTIDKDTFWYFGIPYLNSAGAAATSFLFAGSLPHGMGYLAARAFNWLLAPIFAFSIFTIGRLCGLRGALALLVPAAFLLVPQATFLFSYLNADALGLTATALSLMLFLRSIEKQDIARIFVFGMGCGLVLCTKLYYFPSLVFFGGLFAYFWLSDRQFSPVRFACTAAAGAALVALPVLLTTYVQFGEITGIKGQQTFVQLHKEAAKQCYLLCGDRIIDGPNLLIWLKIFSTSYFYGLGWMDVYLPKGMYSIFYGLTAAIFVTSVVLSIRDTRNFRREGLPCLRNLTITLLFWSMLIAVLISNIIGSQNLLPQPQGRYGLVTLPFAYFLLAVLLGGGRCFTPAVDAAATGKPT